ncbi:DUF92 domain-containing protein [Flavitalea antarctica]
MTAGIIFIILLVLMTGFTLYARKLTLAGAITGAVLASTIFCGTGFPGVILLASFFILATFATSWRFEKKSKIGLSEKNHGRRNSLQVLANGGIAGLLGLAALLFPQFGHSILIIMAASLSSATADTISSELGSLYGKKFVNILTFRSDRRGENGVISGEGLLFGVVGSIMIALAYALSAEFSLATILIIILSGTIGNVVDSILGATLERNGKMNNDAVNFLNTFCGALSGFLLLLI